MNRLYLGGFDGLEAALATEVRAAKENDALAPVTVVVGSAAVASALPRTLAREQDRVRALLREGRLCDHLVCFSGTAKLAEVALTPRIAHLLPAA